MKRLSTWDTYVREANKAGDRSIELPLTEDESFIVRYPTRRRSRDIAKAQREGDTDALLIALLGEEAGKRVCDLAEDQPTYVLDEFLLDVMKKFGFIPDDDRDVEQTVDPANDSQSDDAPAGKSSTPKSKTPSKRLSTASS